MSIFIQIASYRDPQLIPTIKDALAKASRPEELVFGITHQHDPEDAWESLDEWKDDDRFRIIPIHYKDSFGCCWARSKCQALWAGEDYTLQLDSHHRFIEGWDDVLIDMLGRCPSDKPMLVDYMPGFTAGSESRTPHLYEMMPHFAGGVLVYQPCIRTNTGIKRHMSWSGHFMFVRGSFCEEVPYDPELYFIGEEISMAVRSYTHGYDMFLPDAPCVWHQYTREGRSKHWTDHNSNSDSGPGRAFHELDAPSKKKVALLLSGGEVATCGLGTVRTLEDFENAAGIFFSKEYVAKEAQKQVEAPIFTDATWKDRIYYDYKVYVDLYRVAEAITNSKADKVAIFMGDIRKDIAIDKEAGLPHHITIDVQQEQDPKSVTVWAYRTNPLRWGPKEVLNNPGFDKTILGAKKSK